jgi:hypothetical protein
VARTAPLATAGHAHTMEEVPIPHLMEALIAEAVLATKAATTRVQLAPTAMDDTNSTTRFHIGQLTPAFLNCSKFPAIGLDSTQLQNDGRQDTKCAIGG